MGLKPALNFCGQHAVQLVTMWKQAKRASEFVSRCFGESNVRYTVIVTIATQYFNKIQNSYSGQHFYCFNESTFRVTILLYFIQ